MMPVCWGASAARHAAGFAVDSKGQYPEPLYDVRDAEEWWNAAFKDDLDDGISTVARE